MQDKNQIELIGTVFNEPRCTITSTNLHMARLVICVHRPDPSKVMDFLNVVAWREAAEKIAAQFHDGDRIRVKGSLQKQKYMGADGNEKYIYRIIADEVSVPEQTEYEAETV